MRLIAICLLLAAFLTACYCPDEKETAVEFTVPESTAYDFNNDLQLPRGLYRDTSFLYDSVTCSVFYSVLVLSSLPDMNEFNRMVRTIHDQRIRYELSFVDTNKEESPVDPVFTWDMRPVETFMNGNLISICYVVDTYTHGGNHHNYSWFSINYDREKKQEIGFSDIFMLQNHEDTTSFIELVVCNAEINGCMDLSFSYGPPDFSISDSGIRINPDLSWACSMNRSFLPADTLATMPFFRKI
ncbi:MAG: hypothetical protein ABIJ16_07165 [Bacteroidota bacterium]